jgi:hypothetical protein
MNLHFLFGNVIRKYHKYCLTVLFCLTVFEKVRAGEFKRSRSFFSPDKTQQGHPRMREIVDHKSSGAHHTRESGGATSFSPPAQGLFGLAIVFRCGVVWSV